MRDENKPEEEIEDEEECTKNWKLYDDVFHYVFFNQRTNKLIIKKKTDVDSATTKAKIQRAIENELIKVVNGFIPKRMMEYFEDFQGDNQSMFETCGVLLENSRTKCQSIFGANNCIRVPNTIYYTRKCPKGYIRTQKEDNNAY